MGLSQRLIDFVAFSQILQAILSLLKVTYNFIMLYSYYMPEFVLFQAYFLLKTKQGIPYKNTFWEIVILLANIGCELLFDNEKHKLQELDINADIHENCETFSIKDYDKLEVFFNKYLRSLHDGLLKKGVYKSGVFRIIEKNPMGEINDYNNEIMGKLSDYSGIDYQDYNNAVTVKKLYNYFYKYCTKMLNEYGNPSLNICTVAVQIIINNVKEYSTILPAHLLIYLDYIGVGAFQFTDNKKYSNKDYLYYDFELFNNIPQLPIHLPSVDKKCESISPELDLLQKEIINNDIHWGDIIIQINAEKTFLNITIKKLNISNRCLTRSQLGLGRSNSQWELLMIIVLNQELNLQRFRQSHSKQNEAQDNKHEDEFFIETDETTKVKLENHVQQEKEYNRIRRNINNLNDSLKSIFLIDMSPITTSIEYVYRPFFKT